MRIDKFIWAIRVYKTRSLATEACRSSKITINGADVKPAKEVVVGDTIVIRKGSVHFQWQVLDIPKSRVGAKLVPEYAKDITPEEELEKLRMLLLVQKETIRRKPGRPTKKDRRDIDSFFE